MVYTSPGERLASLLLKLANNIAESEDSTESPEEQDPSPAVNTEAEPMKAYWESDKEDLDNKNQPFIDLFLKGVALERIPDVTEEPVKESSYKYDKLVYLQDTLKNFISQGKV